MDWNIQLVYIIWLNSTSFIYFSYLLISPRCYSFVLSDFPIRASIYFSWLHLPPIGISNSSLSLFRLGFPRSTACFYDISKTESPVFPIFLRVSISLGDAFFLSDYKIGTSVCFSWVSQESSALSFVLTNPKSLFFPIFLLVSIFVFLYFFLYLLFTNIIIF